MEILANNYDKRCERFVVDECNQCHSVLLLSGADLEWQYEENGDWYYTFVCEACGHIIRKPPEYGNLDNWKTKEQLSGQINSKLELYIDYGTNILRKVGKNGDSSEKRIDRDESEKES